MTIDRNPEQASEKDYDVIVVGGGIYGAMLALEASLRELSVLVLEKEDFGGATSYNSLRIIHGGLRDLQTLNLKRYWTFGRERRWFLEHFPDLVESLPVLVPLYQHGLLRTDVFRVAFMIDRWLLPRRDREGTDGVYLPYGRVVAPPEVKALFPGVDKRHLRGGALWYDAAVPDSQRLVIEVLRCACGLGATALNYTSATDLLVDRGRVTGVRGHDVERDVCYNYHSSVVVNAAGPWSREVARHFDRDRPALYRFSAAWNVLFDRPAPSECALGVTSPSDGRMCFVHPWKGRLLVGTGHASRTTQEQDSKPTQGELDTFLNHVNEALPGIDLGHRDILHVFSGYLPVEQKGTVKLTKRDHFVEHAKRGGPIGFFSVGSTKLTAARSTAERVLAHVFPGRSIVDSRERTWKQVRATRAEKTTSGVFDYNWYPSEGNLEWRKPLAQILAEEAVVHLDDVMLRRTSLGDNPERALHVAPDICDLFEWDEERCQFEIRRLERHFDWIPHPSEISSDE